MLTRFSVKNFRSFKDELVLDFLNVRDYKFSTECIIDNTISKAIIYGRNGVGKTNIGRALQDIFITLYKARIKYLDDDTSFLNAYSEEKVASFTYEFSFDKQKAIYSYKKSSFNKLEYEKLIINGDVVFEYNHSDKKLINENFNKYGLETIDINKYSESIANNNDDFYRDAFLSWLYSNSSLTNDSIIGKIIMFSETMKFKGMGNLYRDIYGPHIFEKYKDTHELKKMEKFFNDMGVKCTLHLSERLDGSLELYYEYDNKYLAFNKVASSGARDLFTLYDRIINRGSGSNKDYGLIFIDEFDAVYHYEMAEKIIRYIKDNYVESQVIITSHNTNLISNRLFRPDCYFILSSDGKIVPLCDATQRELREGHNLEKMYISGEFSEHE